MPGATPPRSPRRPAARPRLGLERLESRENPATDILTTPFGNAFPVPEGGEIVGASDDGRYVIFQSSATNVIQGQINPIPGATNLFWQDTFTGQRRLVSAEIVTVGQATPAGRVSGAIGGGVVPSVPGSVANAVISADGQSVAFVSTRNANRYDNVATSNNIGTAPVTGTILDNGDVSPDIFFWSAEYTTAAESAGLDYHPTLVSRTRNTNTVSGEIVSEAVGYTSSASNPSLGQDESGINKFVGYVTSRNANAFANDAALNGPPSFPVVTVVDNADNTPDLFTTQVKVNGIQQPSFFYSQVLSVYTDQFGQATAFGRVGSFLQVDPLGRYMSRDGKSFTLLSNLNFNLIDQTQPPSPAGSIEVYHLRYFPQNPGITVGTPALVGLQFPVVTLMTSAPGLSGQSVGAVSFSAIIPPDRPNTVVFSAIVAGGPTTTLVPGYVNQNGGNAELYSREVIGLQNEDTFIPFTTVGNVGPASLLTAQAGSVTNGQNGLLDLSNGSFSTDRFGTVVAFTSTSTNLVSGVSDTNGANDVFVAPMTGGTTVQASVTPFRTTAGNGASSAPVLNTDGSVIAFQSVATNLVPLVSDRNQATDVFVRNLAQGQTALVSGQPGFTRTGTGRSFAPLISGTATGGTVFYTSTATNLVEGFAAPAGVDQGYSIAYPLIQPGASGVVAVSGGVSGQAALATFNADGSLNVGAAVTPFPGFKGAIRVAAADVTGDGTPDLIVGAGPGAAPAVKVYDGVTGALVYSFFPFESSFSGGVYVAGADFDGDGKAEIVVGAGENGGPRVKIFDGATGATLADLFVFEAGFRGGVRVATGDINGDTVPDLIVGAGLGGGPRVTVFSGVGLTAGALTTLADVFVYEPTVRNGAYVGAGDANFDGLADIITGAGPEGAPRVRVFDANLLLAPVAGNPGTIADFFAFPPTDNRDGVRVALAVANGQAIAVTGIGTGGPQVKTFNLGTLAGPVAGSPLTSQFLFDETVGFDGAWVG